MQEKLRINSDIRKSDGSKLESSDTSDRNLPSSNINLSNSTKGLRDKHKDVEEKEHNQADRKISEELDNLYKNEMDILGVTATDEALSNQLSGDFLRDKINSKEESAIALKEKLKAVGKTEKEILKTLITTYKNEPELKIFVENWGNFLELWQFAQDKPLAERKAIETIITKSNFTANNSFDLAISEIKRSSDISVETKLDIQRTFNTKGVNTVKSFDYTLKQEEKYKKSIEKKIQSHNSHIENLNNEIQNLNTELDKLPPNDPKRIELKAKIKEKSELIKNYKQELSVLNETKPDKIQFQLRNDLMGVLNPDGSRSINIGSENFTIQLPGNNLPLMGTKNLRSINVAFPYLALRSQQISDEIFAPDLVNNSVPTKKQRDMAHIIISSLGIDDNRILSENDIVQLKKDLFHLTNSESGKTGRECLVELGIYDFASQNVNKNQLKMVLRFIRENRGENFDFRMIQKIILPNLTNSYLN